MGKPIVSVACIVVCSSLSAPGAAFAQDPGVHFDSGSPAGKEYAIPLAEGRAEGAGTTNQRAAATTPFGVGVTPPGGGGGGGPAGSGGTGGDGARGEDGGAKGSGAEQRGAGEGGDGRGSKPPAVDERAVANSEAPVDTTARTMGIGFVVVAAAVLLALLLWWRREQPAG